MYWRDASDFSVGGSGGGRLNGLEHAASSGRRRRTRAAVRRTAVLPRRTSTIVDLRDRKARLRTVSGEALLLSQQVRHRQLLHRISLLARQLGHARNHSFDARRQSVNASGKRIEPRRLVALGGGERGIVLLSLAQVALQFLHAFLCGPKPHGELITLLPEQSAGRAPIALACLRKLGIAACVLERLVHAVEPHLQFTLAQCGECRRISVALDLLQFGAQRLIALVGAGKV